jgi:hypothetical protein
MHLAKLIKADLAASYAKYQGRPGDAKRPEGAEPAKN